MSLINDALQRAKQVQEEQQPTIHNLVLRPTKKKKTKSTKVPGWVLPAAFVGIGVVGIGVFFLQNRTAVVARQPQVETQASAPGSPIPTPVVEPTPPAPVQPTPQPSTPISHSAQAMAHVEPATTMETAATSETPENGAVVPAENAGEAAPTAVEPLRLQGILYNHTKPSAYLGGRTVYIGSRIRDYQVADITQSSVTLVSQTATNVLELY